MYLNTVQLCYPSEITSPNPLIYTILIFSYIYYLSLHSLCSLLTLQTLTQGQFRKMKIESGKVDKLHTLQFAGVTSVPYSYYYIILRLSHIRIVLKALRLSSMVFSQWLDLVFLVWFSHVWLFFYDIGWFRIFSVVSAFIGASWVISDCSTVLLGSRYFWLLLTCS